MPILVAAEDAQARQRVVRGNARIPYLDASSENPDVPYAFQTLDVPGIKFGPHFHTADQWQFIAAGQGTLGRDKVTPYCLHFSRAYTPYGPLIADETMGMSHFDLYTHYQPGAQYLPQTMDALKQVQNRRPWQVKRQVICPSQKGSPVSDGIHLEEIPGMKDEDGLFAYTLAMAPNTTMTSPDPSVGAGQYIVAVTGSFKEGKREYRPISMVFISPFEGPFHIQAGAQGLEAMILNFPRTENLGDAKKAVAADAKFRKWECQLCSFVYDEAAGLPEEGIPPGTRWQDVPESWTCPDCSATKSDFQMAEIG